MTKRRSLASAAFRRSNCIPLAATKLLLLYSFLSSHESSVYGFAVNLQVGRVPSGSVDEPSTSSARPYAPPLQTPPNRKQQRRKSFQKPNQQPPIQRQLIPKKILKISDDPSRTESIRSGSVPKSVDRQKTLLKKDVQPKAPVEPYQAGYHASIKTQALLKDIAADSLKVPSASDRASRVLETFLATPPRQCNAANIVCALTSSAKLLERAGEMSSQFETLLYQTCDILRIMLDGHLLTARQLCNAAWALAKLYDVNPQIMPHPDELLALSSNKFLGQAETWDLEKQSLSHGLDELVDQLALGLSSMLRNNMACAKVGELSMASWAYGVMRPRRRPPGWKHVPQLDELKDSASNRKPTIDRRLSNDNQFLIRYETWSVDSEKATSIEPSTVTDNLLDAISDSLLSRDKLANDTQRLRMCQWNELATTAWAFASHGHCNSLEAQNLMLGIATEAANRLRKDSGRGSILSRDIAQVVWALGTLQADNFRLVDGLLELIGAVDEYRQASFAASVSSRPFESWSCVDIVQLVVSMAHARLDETNLLISLFDEAYIRLSQGLGTKSSPAWHRSSFSSWEVSMLLWAQARLYLNEKQGSVFASFSSRAVKEIMTASSRAGSLEKIGIHTQEQANLAWSLTVLQAYGASEGVALLSAVFDEVASVCERDGVIHLEHAHQLWQALFVLEDDYPSAVQNVPTWLYDYLQSRWRAEKARAKVSSARHRALSQTLKLMGISHVNEHDEDIDVAIVLRPKASWTHETKQATHMTGMDGEAIKVAVEFDGPNHFTRQRQPSIKEQPRPLGQNVLKYRILKKQGWTVVRVPYFEFDKIPFWASMERQRYLQRLLKTHGNLRFSEMDVSEYKVQVPNRKTRFD